MTNRYQRLVVVWLALLGAVPAGAGELPGSARGSTWLLDPAERARADLIDYRPLTRSDFRAKAPPAQARAQAARLGAATCSYLVPDPLRITARPRRAADGGWVYDARPERLHFRAAMDRRCSWWNDAAPLPAEYVLQHEQIHFALTELAARDLNARADELLRRASVTDRSADAAIEASGRRVQALLEETQRALLARNDRFDAETSLGVRRDAQDRWWRRIHQELALP